MTVIFCLTKAVFIDKIMMKGFASMLKKKNGIDGYDADMAKAIESSFDISERKHIMPLVDYLKNQ